MSTDDNPIFTSGWVDAEIERKDAEIASLRAVVQAGIDLITGEAVGSEWKQGCRAFVSDARAVLRGDKPKHVGLIAPVSQPNTEVLQRALGANRRRKTEATVGKGKAPQRPAQAEYGHAQVGPGIDPITRLQDGD